MCFGTSSGTLSQLLHFGPLIAIFLISYITISGLHCLLQWWPPNTTGGIIHIIIYCTWPFIIFYNYFNAVFLGPGFVPKNWRPENPEDEKKLQYCKTCDGFKAPRSHHCRKCNRCVFKMDHHCPWINTCCGHLNHSSFVYFLLFAPLGCIHACLVLGPSIYRGIFRQYYIFYDVKDVPLVNLGFAGLIACMFAIGMAIGVTIAVGILFVIQMKSIVRNQTGIENWIFKKAIHRRIHFKVEEPFVYPYDLGLKENLRQVFNWTGNFRPIGNGIWWNVAKNCDQFSLTIEQLSQKEEKRNHGLKYLSIDNYDGKMCTCKYGCKVACCFPWTEDPRMQLVAGDQVLVTRWQKHWLYGEKSEFDQKLNKKILKKGWFPTKCVRLDEKQNSAILKENNLNETEEQNSNQHEKKD